MIRESEGHQDDPQTSRSWVTGLCFSVGTLTVIPMPAPRIDRDVARAGMLWTPAVGALIGMVQCGVLAGAHWASGDTLLPAALTIAAGALLTRGLHLDGLADVADGLGSGRPAADALEIMKRSDIGPFGVVALVLTLLIQVAALAAADHGHGLGYSGLAIVTAATAGRLVLPWACRRGVPAARAEGLGVMVAETTPLAGAMAITLIVIAIGTVAAGLAHTIVPPVAILTGLGAAGLFLRHVTRRLGGITGDVLGALVEIATTVALLVAAVR